MRDRDLEEIYGRFFAVETMLSRLMTDHLRHMGQGSTPDHLVEKYHALAQDELVFLNEMTETVVPTMTPQAQLGFQQCVGRTLQSASEWALYLDQLDER